MDGIGRECKVGRGKDGRLSVVDVYIINVGQIVYCFCYDDIVFIFDCLCLCIELDLVVVILCIGEEWYEEQLYVLICVDVGQFWKFYIVVDENVYFVVVGIKDFQFIVFFYVLGVLFRRCDVYFLVFFLCIIVLVQVRYIIEMFIFFYFRYIVCNDVDVVVDGKFCEFFVQGIGIFGQFLYGMSFFQVVVICYKGCFEKFWKKDEIGLIVVYGVYKVFYLLDEGIKVGK